MLVAIGFGGFHQPNHGITAYSPQPRVTSQKPSTVTKKKELMKRRLFFFKAASTAVVSTATAAILLAKPKTAHGVISSKYCAYGEGEGCDDLAEGNPLILELQRKSSANKETIQKEARDAFYMKNYPDWFASVGKSMVKKPDGSFMVVTDEELAALKAQNRIGLEYARTMGGKVADITQKPIMVLKE
ncbi:hypothetical protein IV203_026027 [Nitzschia inconspicua]|uniref:Uncharacterized protein n=1 Tax=Nitzschia inconspicua TaxID=303405 RepID=A0A9K3PAR9_9STRA|nr:hypothetical protein IV203_009425 [Nitzschia inconspicua]KAG7362667.1 hypothetical protein IV203_026027 [Nitzschia inconspicua]